MKIYLILLLAVCSLNLNAQEVTIEIKGQLSDLDTDKKAGDVTISIWENGKPLTETMSKKNGKYAMEFPVSLNATYKILYQKEGLVSKHLLFNLKRANEEDFPEGNNLEFPELSLALFHERDNVDFSFLDSVPVAKFDWSERVMGFRFDAVHSQNVRNRMNQLLKESEKQAPK